MFLFEEGEISFNHIKIFDPKRRNMKKEKRYLDDDILVFGRFCRRGSTDSCSHSGFADCVTNRCIDVICIRCS